VVIWAVTLWILFACWLLATVLGAPRVMARVSLGLLFAEFVAVAVWSYGSEGCASRPCAVAAEIGRAAATQDIPVIAAVLIALAVFRAHRQATAPPAALRRRASRG
jgi:hypothetical protein